MEQYESVLDKLLKQAAWVVVIGCFFWLIGQLFLGFFRVIASIISALNDCAVYVASFLFRHFRGKKESKVRIPEFIPAPRKSVEFNGKGLFDPNTIEQPVKQLPSIRLFLSK